MEILKILLALKLVRIYRIFFFFPPIFSTWNIEINFIIVVKLSQRVRKYRISKLYYCISQLY